jgi:hypothetical protein
MAKSTLPETIGGIFWVAVAIGIYFAWPRIAGYWDVEKRTVAPDISQSDLRESLKRLDPPNRERFEAYVQRKRPDPSRLGDWPSTLTVGGAIADEHQLEQLSQKVTAAKDRLKISLVSYRLYRGDDGAARFEGTFANLAKATATQFEGTVIYFLPPAQVLKCFGVRTEGPAVSPGNQNSWTWTLTSQDDLDLTGAAPGGSVDFVPSAVAYNSNERATFPLPELCQRH